MNCIALKKSNCKNCYKCIRHCPVKAIRFSGNQAYIIDNECILCGHCFVVCPQNAKQIVDETEKAKVLIQSPAPVIASIAPSFVANYDGVGIEAMRDALKKLGFFDAEETAIGATVVKTEYERMLREDAPDVVISSCCHSVNLLIQKHYPRELSCLAPVLSPMQAHCRDIKRRHPEAKTVFIGPCVAKKDEAEHYDGIVDAVDANRIVVRSLNDNVADAGVEIYKLQKFRRSNQNTCINQVPLVKVGDHVKAGDIMADGPCTDMGELALGRNLLVAFMPWNGLNYEDAILLSENISRNDVLTSLHIEEFEVMARDTKLGQEEITRDIPNVGEEALRNLDEAGIVYIGAEVKAGDILVGKVTPKGESPVTPEEKLLRAIFGEKASDVRDTSLRVQPGIEGIVVDVHVFSRRGVEKDERALSIEQEEISQLAKDRDDEIAIIRRSFEARLQSMLMGQKVVDAPKGIAKNATITEEVLSAVPSSQWRKIVVKDEEVMARIEEFLAAFDARVEKVQKHFENKVEKVQRGDDLLPGVLKMVKVFIATKRKIQTGDKIAGRHGNKGTISRVLPLQDMPYMEDGTPVDIVLNPLGVPSRMNVGQILETHLGWAASELGKQLNEMCEQYKRGEKTIDELNAKLKAIYGEKQYKNDIEPMNEAEKLEMISNLKNGVPMATPVFDGAHEDDINNMLELAGLPTSGQIDLYDGRTGEKFDRKVTVGTIYMIKLHHIVDEKMHARSVGPYSLVTQQPLGGKAQFGGQRFGEMEVWALEAYGAAYTLQEMLTVKSDDVNGRTKVYEAIVRGDDGFEAGVPESFNVLVKEIKSLCLNVELLNEEV